MIIEIIRAYDPATNKFRLVEELVDITREDIVKIFGISCGTEYDKFKNCSKEDVNMAIRRKIKDNRLTSGSLKTLLSKYAKGKKIDDIQDVARLLCLHLCHALFFSSATSVKWSSLEKVEDFEKMKLFDWNRAILDALMSSIKKNHQHPRKVKCCVTVLMVSLNCGIQLFFYD